MTIPNIGSLDTGSYHIILHFLFVCENEVERLLDRAVLKTSCREKTGGEKLPTYKDPYQPTKRVKCNTSFEH